MRTVAMQQQPQRATAAPVCTNMLCCCAAVLGADLPQERPPPNSPLGYQMCDYSCMTNFASSVKSLSATKGVLEVDVK